MGCESLSGHCEGLNGFFKLGDPKGLIHKVLKEGRVGLLELVNFQLLLILCLKEGSKACAMGRKGYGVVFQSLGVFGSILLKFFVISLYVVQGLFNAGKGG